VHDATALPNGIALPPLEAPTAVRQIIEAGNVIARTPYLWGGGHGKWLDTGYDCSGSVSFALAAAGLLDAPLASGPLMSWGEAGAGKWVTIWSSPATCSWRWRGSASTPRPARDRLALAERHALHRGVRRPPSARALSPRWGPNPISLGPPRGRCSEGSTSLLTPFARRPLPHATHRSARRPPPEAGRAEPVA
jgi:hypothetical protein